MATKLKKNSEALNLAKMFLFAIIAALMVTGILLILAAVLLEKLGLTESQAKILIYGIYVASALLAGLIAGKWQREKKFMWGVLAGTVWFLVVLIASIVTNGMVLNVKEFFPAAVCMLGGGMLGGMLA